MTRNDGIVSSWGGVVDVWFCCSIYAGISFRPISLTALVDSSIGSRLESTQLCQNMVGTFAQPVGCSLILSVGTLGLRGDRGDGWSAQVWCLIQDTQTLWEDWRAWMVPWYSRAWEHHLYSCLVKRDHMWWQTGAGRWHSPLSPIWSYIISLKKKQLVMGRLCMEKPSVWVWCLSRIYRKTDSKGITQVKCASGGYEQWDPRSPLSSFVTHDIGTSSEWLFELKLSEFIKSPLQEMKDF